MGHSEALDELVEQVAVALYEAPAYTQADWARKLPWAEDAAGHCEYDRNQWRIRAQAAIDALINAKRLKDLRAAIEREQQPAGRAEELLYLLVAHEDSRCSFDHHGYCQEHGWFGEPGECGIREARQLLGLDQRSSEPS